MHAKKYQKKIIVTNEFASAESRGKRLKRIRNLANLSRKELCDLAQLNLNTYKSWELGRFGGLPLDRAKQVITSIIKKNVICSLEWLLYEQGAEPHIIPQINELSLQMVDASILKELRVFQSCYANIIYLKITDNSLSPIYDLGDYVAGIKYGKNDISLCINQICILGLSNGQLTCKYMHKEFLDEDFKNLEQVQFDFAAPIIRHYKSINSLIV